MRLEQVYHQAAGMRQREDVLSGGSYLSSNDLRIHFGLADATDGGTLRFTGHRARRKL